MGAVELTGSDYRIRVTYTRPVAPAENAYLQIMSMFEPTGSYVDSAAYTGAEGDTVWSDKVVGATDITSTRAAGATSAKSIYSTNVPGWGTIDPPEFFKDTHIPFPLPLAQFIYDSVKGTDGDTAGDDSYLEFVVHTYEEAFYYAQLKKDMKDQGFEFYIEPIITPEG